MVGGSDEQRNASAIAALREASEASKIDRRDIWTVLGTVRDAGADFKSGARMFVDRMDRFERETAERWRERDKREVAAQEAHNKLVARVERVERSGDRSAGAWSVVTWIVATVAGGVASVVTALASWFLGASPPHPPIH